MEFRDLGAKLRFARKLKRLRQKDVAELVDCSESLVSKIECDKATPSLRLLHRIASALDTSIADLFSDPGEPDVTIYHYGQRPTVVIKDGHDAPAIRLERLAPYAEDRLLDGNVHVIEPGANNGGEIKHQGQEIGYVIEGRFELTVGERTFLLSVGRFVLLPLRSAPLVPQHRRYDSEGGVGQHATDLLIAASRPAARRCEPGLAAGPAAPQTGQ